MISAERLREIEDFPRGANMMRVEAKVLCNAYRELEAARTRIAELETEARAMSEALRYGEHAPDCDIEYEGRPCNCGLGTVTGSQAAAVRLTEDERDAIGFAIYVIDQDAGDWSDHGGTTQTHREYAAILRRLGGQTT